MTEDALKKVIRAFAVVSVAVGGLGSIACLPYALTSSLTLIWITGIYFIAGGVMIVGGLIALAILSPQTAS